MEKEEIQAKIAYTQELINNENDQNKRDELYQDLKVLRMRLDMNDSRFPISARMLALFILGLLAACTSTTVDEFRQGAEREPLPRKNAQNAGSG